MFLLNYKNERPKLVFAGNLLFSGPEEGESLTPNPQTVKPNPRSKFSHISLDPSAPSSLTLESNPNKKETLTRSISRERPGTDSKPSSKMGRLTDTIRRSTQQVVEVDVHTVPREMTPLSKTLSMSTDSIQFEELDESLMI